MDRNSLKELARKRGEEGDRGWLTPDGEVRQKFSRPTISIAQIFDQKSAIRDRATRFPGFLLPLARGSLGEGGYFLISTFPPQPSLNASLQSDSATKATERRRITVLSCV
jgi:hypothetical protein